MNNNNQNSDFILYTSQDGEIRVDVFVNNETVWLTQKAMQELFDRSKSTVSEHISNVFKEGELEESQVVRKFRTTAFSTDAPSAKTYLQRLTMNRAWQSFWR